MASPGARILVSRELSGNSCLWLLGNYLNKRRFSQVRTFKKMCWFSDSCLDRGWVTREKLRNEKRQRQSCPPVFFCKTLCPRCNARCTVCGAVDGCAALCCHVWCLCGLSVCPAGPSRRDLEHICCLTPLKQKAQRVWGRGGHAHPPRPPNVLCRGHMSGLDFILRPPCQWRALVNSNWPVDCDKDPALNIKTNQSINQ